MGRRGGAGSLSEVVQFLRGDIALVPMRSVNGWSDVGSAEQELDFGEVKGQQHVNAQLRSPPPVGITFSPLDLLRRTRLNPLNFRCYAYWHRGTDPRNDEVLDSLNLGLRLSLDCGCVTVATQGGPDNRFTVITRTVLFHSQSSSCMLNFRIIIPAL
jgi:hypothetical protein